ncbi:ABC transporter permease, partial [Bacteroidota bacterium]
FDYIDLMQMKIIKGRNYKKEMKTDPKNSILVNEALIKKFQWGDSALGKKIHVGFDIDKSGGQIMKVIGIIKDFNYESLKSTVDPLVIFCNDEPNQLLHVKITKNTSETLEFIKNKWESFNPKYPFDFVFLEERIDELYTNEEKLNKIFTYSSALCIFIALLGLLGLSSFIAEQRYKEIGIRKVLGAILGDIIKLLYKEFLILVIIAYIPASIISYFLMRKWLDVFAYHTEIHWMPFIIGGLFAFIIASLTISYHIFKAAKENPSNAIKYE